jgi:hypothetical protein
VAKTVPPNHAGLDFGCRVEAGDIDAEWNVPIDQRVTAR